MALICGAGGLPGRVSYLADLPSDPRGRAARDPPRHRISGAGGAGGGRQPSCGWRRATPSCRSTADAAAWLRDILREASATGRRRGSPASAAPFHVLGSLPGESETQFFLQTADNRPISINVLRRPGEQPRWSVALGEMVDEAAETVRAKPALVPARLHAAARCPAATPERGGSRRSRAIRADYGW